MTSSDLKDRVDFGLIRYANCWEDAEILLRGLAAQPGSKILSVASAGDNSFSLLTTAPERVVAVDISRPQLFLTELKKICLARLDRSETLSFLGFRESASRKQMFTSLKKELSTDARRYWERNEFAIQKGVIHQGKFEKYFQLFSQKILPLIHSSRTIEKLLATKVPLEQEDFYNKHWNTWRWRLLFRVFFSRFVMGRLGRDPAFLTHVEGSVSEFILEKAARHLISELAQDNFILRYALTGNFVDLLPHYLQENQYPVVQKNINQLLLFEGYAQEAAESFGPFSSMNLSNIFEYMDEKTFRSSALALIKNIENEGTIAYWNLMVPRRISELFPESVGYSQELSEQLTQRDRGFFYQKFIVDQMRG